MRDEIPIVTKTTAVEAALTASSAPSPPPSSKFALPDHTSSDIMQPQLPSSVYAKLASQRIDITPPEGTPKLRPASSMEVPVTKITTLENGFRIASQETYGQLSTVGLLVDAGSRYEVRGVDTGVNHLYELMAFKGTENKSHQEIMTEIECMGGMATTNSSREQFLICIDSLRNSSTKAVQILADAIQRPKLTRNEVDEMKAVMEFQMQELDLGVLLKEGIQAAAYGNQSLGNPHFCPPEHLATLSLDTLHQYRSNFFVAPRMILAGAGVNHDEFVELGSSLFGSMPKSSSTTSSEAPKRIPSVYRGGESRLVKESPDGLTKVAVAFEVGGWHSPDLVPICVLQVLLGGGDSFSAGGPGKGMYSRLYREVLNRYHWAEAAEAFTAIHDESGLLGIAGSSTPDKSADLTLVFLEHFAKLAVQPVTQDELSRARNMLRCNVLTQLESRMVLFEDIGRQILTYGKRESPGVICQKIDAVTVEDIMRVAKKAFLKPPSISCVGGDIGGVPTYDRIASGNK